MDTNVPMDMTVAIACTRRRDTNHVPRQKIQWEGVCYTNDSHITHDGLGQEKGVLKQVSFKRLYK